MKSNLVKFIIPQPFPYEIINEIVENLFPNENYEFFFKQIYNNKNLFQNLFSIKEVFHRHLYYDNEIFYLKKEYIIFEISNYFYIDLLINDDLNIINYNYDIDLIILIDNKNRFSENSLKKAIISKIINDLINNFKNVIDYNVQKFEKKLKEIEKNNKKIIEESIDKIKKLKINLTIGDIIEKKIEDIYIKVIESIIISDKFEEVEKIFLQLGLDVINIANIKFKELEKIVEKPQFIILEIQDLFDEKKINYYYFLVKYIFKTSSSIYNINLLKNFQQFLIKIIKSQLSELSFNYIDNETIYEKRNYVIKFILNNEYYYQKYSEAFKLIELINYYKKYSNESNKEEIKSIEMILKNNKINKKYEIEYSNFLIIKNLFKKHIFKDLQETTQVWMDIKKLIKKKSLNELVKYNELLIKCFRDEFIKEIFIKIFPKDIFDYFNKEISNIKAYVNNQNSNINNKGIQSSDVNNENNGNTKRDNKVNEIRNLQEYSSDYIIFCTFLFPSLHKNEESKKIFSYYITKRKNNFDEKIEFASNNIKFEGKFIKKIKKWIEKADEKDYKIIKNSKELLKGLINWEKLLEKINEDFEIELEFIFKREKDLSNELFYNISYECYQIKKEIKESEKQNEPEETKVSKEKIYEERKELKSKILNALNINNGMNIENIISEIGKPIKKENNEIIKERSIISFIFKGIRERNNIEDKRKVNENLNLINKEMKIDGKLHVILTQEGDLIIHWETGRIFKIVGFSIEISNNKICIIHKSNENNDRLLICCCKNQIKEKNGILLIELDIKETEALISNITDFQVEHMCHLNMSGEITRINSNSIEKNNIKGNSNNNDFSKKNYLILAGYNIKENKPKVKLFQILLDGNKNEGKGQMKVENINGIRMLELYDEVLSTLEFKSNIISIHQNESEIIILTKDSEYYLSYHINDI